MKEQTPPEVSLWVHSPLRESAEEGVHTSTYAHKVLGPGHWGKPRFPCSARPPAHLLHQQVLELPLAVLHALAVGAVHHPDEAVGALKVVPPVGPQGLLAAHIPDVQLESGQGGGGWRSAWPLACPPCPALGGPPLGDPAHPRCSRVLMLKPSVGEMVSMSSPLNFLRMVVLPALSRPLGCTRLRRSPHALQPGDIVTVPLSWGTNHFPPHIKIS